jgi:hypothetical protein
MLAGGSDCTNPEARTIESQSTPASAYRPASSIDCQRSRTARSRYAGPRHTRLSESASASASARRPCSRSKRVGPTRARLHIEIVAQPPRELGVRGQSAGPVCAAVEQGDQLAHGWFVRRVQLARAPAPARRLSGLTARLGLLGERARRDRHQAAQPRAGLLEPPLELRRVRQVEAWEQIAAVGAYRLGTAPLGKVRGHNARVAAELRGVQRYLVGAAALEHVGAERATQHVERLA